MAESAAILNLNIRDMNDLYNAYMGFVENGALFIETNSNHQMGSEVFVLLKLYDQEETFPFAGKVVWLAKEDSADKKPGIGVQFGKNDAELNEKIRLKLQDYKS